MRKDSIFGATERNLTHTPTGVGKTFLAQKYYNYCLLKNYLSGEFVQLNCAEYADNPELLTSILFGYKKELLLELMQIIKDYSIRQMEECFYLMKCIV